MIKYGSCHVPELTWKAGGGFSVTVHVFVIGSWEHLNETANISWL